MGIVDYPFRDLIRKVRSWCGGDSGGLGMSGYCYECRGLFGAPGYGHRCRSCWRLFCRKCMQAGSGQPKFCKFCFHAISSSSGDGLSRVMPDSPLSRIRSSRLAHLAELSNFSSPRSFRYIICSFECYFVIDGS